MNVVSIAKTSLLIISSMLRCNHKSKILFYHDVCKGQSYRSLDSDVLMGTDLEMFKRHLEVINKEGYSIVPKITKEKGEVCIMFDDGFRGIFDNRQFFYDKNIFPTVFLAHDLIGKDGFLSVDEIIELQEHGFIFECHSWTHTNLAEKTDAELRTELVESKVFLGNMLGKEVTELCLPIGYFSDHLIEMCKKAGYKEVYSSIPGNYSEKVLGNLRTRNLCQFATPFELKMILRGGNEILKGRYEKMHHLPDFK